MPFFSNEFQTFLNMSLNTGVTSSESIIFYAFALDTYAYFTMKAETMSMISISSIFSL